MAGRCADYCQRSELGIASSRDVIRCQHFSRWFKRLRANKFELFISFGFEDWDYFTQHHINCDNEAYFRFSKTRPTCSSDEECKHNGYRKTYPILEKSISRRRHCFRQLPSISRYDITDEIEAVVGPGGDVATWTPVMLLMFAPWNAVVPNPRKAKRQIDHVNSAPLKWDRTMRKTLDKVELLGLAFIDDPGEMSQITELFGKLSVEAETLRLIRDTVRPSRPVVVKPSTCSYRSEDPDLRASDSKSKPTHDRGGPKTNSGHVPEPLEKKGKEKSSEEAKETKMSKPTDVEEDASSTAKVGIEPVQERLESEHKQAETLVVEGRVPRLVANPEDEDTYMRRFLRFEDDKEWLGDEENLRPAIKRRRSTQGIGQFRYTHKPDVYDRTMWRDSWLLFYKAQEVLRRGPGADAPESMGSTVPTKTSSR